jgi:hypothetical protein
MCGVKEQQSIICEITITIKAIKTIKSEHTIFIYPVWSNLYGERAALRSNRIK